LPWTTPYLGPHIYDTERIVNIMAKDGTLMQASADFDARRGSSMSRGLRLYSLRFGRKNLQSGRYSIGQTPSVAGYIVAARSGMWPRIV
jgi:hypothetical protein